MAPGIPTTHCQDYFYLEDNLIFMDDLPCNEVDIPEQQLDDNCDTEDDVQYYSGHNNHQLCESPQYTYCPNSSSTPPLLSDLKFTPNETRGQMLGFVYRGCHNEQLHTRVHCTHEGAHDEAGAVAQCDETHRDDSVEQDMLSDDTHYIHRCPFKHCSGHHHHIKNKQNKHKYNKTLLRISTSIKDEQSTTYNTLVNDNKNCTMVDGTEASQLLRINSSTSRQMNSDETVPPPPPPPAAAAAALNLLGNYQSSFVTRSISCRTGHRPLLQEEKKQENLYEKPGSDRLATEESHSHHQQHVTVKAFPNQDQSNNCEMFDATEEGSPCTAADQVKDRCRSMGRQDGYVIGTDTRQRCDSPLYGDTTPVMVTGATKRCPTKDGKFYPSPLDEHQVTPTFRKRAIEYIVEQFGGGAAYTNTSDTVSTSPSSSPSNSEAVSRLYRTVERLEQTVYCAAAHRSKENYMRMLASKLATVYEELQHSHQWQQHAPSRSPAAGHQQQQQQGCSRPLLVPPSPPSSRQHLGAAHGGPRDGECDGSSDSNMEVCSTNVEQNSCDT